MIDLKSFVLEQKCIPWRVRNRWRVAPSVQTKNDAELDFWTDLFHERGREYWREIYFAAYCFYLGVDADSFAGQRILDVGCGPHGALSLFHAHTKIGVDPLANRYHRAFGVASDDDTLYLSCPSERIPLTDGALDVVISRNALDHVDDFGQTIAEIHRVLKPGGRILFGINFQPQPTVCEPQVLDGGTIEREFRDRFDYEITRRFPTRYVWEHKGEVFQYEHDIVIVHGVNR